METGYILLWYYSLATSRVYSKIADNYGSLSGTFMFKKPLEFSQKKIGACHLLCNSKATKRRLEAAVFALIRFLPDRPLCNKRISLWQSAWAPTSFESSVTTEHPDKRYFIVKAVWLHILPSENRNTHQIERVFGLWKSIVAEFLREPAIVVIGCQPVICKDEITLNRVLGFSLNLSQGFSHLCVFF